MRTQLASYNFKVFQWLTRNLPNSFYSFENYQADFLRIMHHAFFGCHGMTHSRQTFWTGQGHEILIFQTVNCNVCKSWLALGRLPCPSLHYITLQSQLSTEPILLQNQLTIQACFISNCLIIYELMKYTTEMWEVKSCSAIHRFKIK